MLVALLAVALMVTAPMALAAVRTGTDAYIYADGWDADFIKDSGGQGHPGLLPGDLRHHRQPLHGPHSGPGRGRPRPGAGRGGQRSGFRRGHRPPDHGERAHGERQARSRQRRGRRLRARQHLLRRRRLRPANRLRWERELLHLPATSYPKSDGVYSGLGGVVQAGSILDGGGQDAVNLKP